MLDTILEAAILLAVVFEAYISWKSYVLLKYEYDRQRIRRILRKVKK